MGPNIKINSVHSVSLWVHVQGVEKLIYMKINTDILLFDDLDHKESI